MSDFELFHDAALAELRRDPLATVDWREAEPESVGLAALCLAQGKLATLSYALGQLGIAAGTVGVQGGVELAVLPGAGPRISFSLEGRWFEALVDGPVDGHALDPQLRWLRVPDTAVVPRAEPVELALAHLGAAFDLLGCCDAMVDLAVAYARDRQQFGRAIGEFQAVQHLLAQAHVQREGLRSLCFAALDSIDIAIVAKAHGGSVAARIAQATLQVLGAIGFTMEHEHQRYYRRAMVLDAAFASSRTLFRQLGERCAQGAIDRLIWIG